ncbi:unnamed protein product [Prunus armeniaca]
MPSPSETHNNNSFAVAENLRFSMEELSYPHQQDHHVVMEIELQNELGFNPYSTNTDQNNNNIHLVSFEQQTNWDNIHGVHDQMQQQLQDGANGGYPPTPDLLNLFSLPRCSPSSVLQNSSITFTNPNPKSSNFPNSLGFLGDVHGGIDTPPGTSLPHGYSLPGSRNGSLFTSGGDEGEGIGGGVYSDGINNGRQFENRVLEFSREMGSIARGREEQKLGDTGTEGNNVGTECVMDYSDQFTTYLIFKGRDALIRWARAQGKMNNIVIVIVITRYDARGEGNRRPRGILACERSGKYRSCKSSETTGLRSNANGDRKMCSKDSELEKKNATLADLLSSEQARHEIETLDLKKEISLLKSSLALKDGELDSTIAAFNQQKKNYFMLEHEFDDLSQSHDKLLSMFDAFRKDTQKSEVNAYKLGYLDCQRGVASIVPLVMMRPNCSA